MTKVSVVVVTWYSEDEIRRCLTSVTGKCTEKPEIIVVDNASGDGTVRVIKDEFISDVKFFENQTNEGFTRAVNKGISACTGEYIFLLNPDTKLLDDACGALSGFLDANPQYCAAAPRLISPDGTTQHSIRSFPTYWKMFKEFTFISKVSRNTWKDESFNYGKDSDVEQPMAAALMIRKNVLDAIGPMDNRFRMFFNDVDLCKRIIDGGYRIRYMSGVRVSHKKGASVYKDRARMIRIWGRDCAAYFEKHFRNPAALAWLRMSLKVSEKLRILLRV